MINIENLTQHLGMDKPVLENNEVHDLFECYELVKDILETPEKAAAWFLLPNPNFGEGIPINFFLVGRGHKVKAFIKGVLDRSSEEVL